MLHIVLGTQEVFENVEIPQIDAGETAELTCTNPETDLNGSLENQNYPIDYQWITNNGNIIGNADSSEILVNQSGFYILNIIKLSNGCATTDTLEVTPFPGISFETISESD